MTRAKIWNEEIDFYINCGQASLGCKSSFAGQINVIESGGAHNTDTPEWKFDPETVRRASRSDRVWKNLDAYTQNVLIAHYAGAIKTESTKSTGTPTYSRFPLGVAGRLFDPPGVALFLAHQAGELATLLTACEKNTTDVIHHWQEKSFTEQVIAHKNWALGVRLMSPGARSIREAMGA